MFIVFLILECYDEIILYLVIENTNLHTLFNLLNLIFENIGLLNYERIFSAEKKIVVTGKR